jgi:hypothetical protein
MVSNYGNSSFMLNGRMCVQASAIAASYFRNDKTPTYSEIVLALRDNYGDAVYVPRLGAMVLSKLNEYRASFVA